METTAIAAAVDTAAQASESSGNAIPATIPLVFERLLRPGRYTLILRLEDLNGGGFYRTGPDRVPALEGAGPPAPDPSPTRIFAEANAAIPTHDNTLAWSRRGASCSPPWSASTA